MNGGRSVLEENLHENTNKKLFWHSNLALVSNKKEACHWHLMRWVMTEQKKER